MSRRTRVSATLTALLSLATATALASPALGSPSAVFPSRVAARTAPVAGVSAPATSLVTRASYRNPVSKPFADTYADPSLIRGLDGWWYSYGTSDPLRSTETSPHRIPIARSRDLVHWSYVGDAFTATTLPSWAAADAGLWGPDIRYVDGHYRLYYVVTQTTVTPEPNDNAIGMATAPTPAGPWTDSGSPVIAPRHGPGGSGDFKWTFDPSVVTDTDGSQWMFYGSYYGGIFVQRLAADGRTLVGGPTMVAIDNKFEGAYAVHRGGYWYLFASTANCCAGVTTGYSVQVGRSRSIAGPYVDRQGAALLASRAGGTPTLNQNGNRWIGAGHNAIATDLSGQDWIVYHAIDRRQPYLVGTDGINRRPMLMDRLDWVNGWPAVRGGRGPSSTTQSGPATGGRWVTDFTGGIPTSWMRTGAWSPASTPQTGPYEVSVGSATLYTCSTRFDSARLEADLASTGKPYGLQAHLGSSLVRVLISPEQHTVVLQQRSGGHLLSSRTAPLPQDFDARAWHAVSLELRHGRAVAEVTHDRLGDPLAVASLALRGGGQIMHAGVVAMGGGVSVDNLSVLPAAAPVRHLVSDQVPSHLDASASDEFNGPGLGSGWSWVRPDPKATVGSGRLSWPVESADLVGTGNDAGVLLRSVGTGPWTIQTKVTVNLGTNDLHNFQQAGLVAYVNDDLFTRFSQVAIFNTRQTEFGLERPYAGRLSYGGTIVGPPATTTYLRLTHRVNPSNGEHELRAWSRRPGHGWVKGGVWTLPKDATIRVGLVALGRAADDKLVATAKFDYFRVYR